MWINSQTVLCLVTGQKNLTGTILVDLDNFFPLKELNT